MTRPLRHRIACPRRAARGFSLLELMTSITIGLLIMAGLASVFVNSSTANKEMKNNAEQIENGRYAIEFLTQDVRHAGYYGELAALPAVPATAPDPCAAPTAGAVSDTVNSALAIPVQYISAASIPAGCGALLTAANLIAGSDIVVVRRADTTLVNSAGSGTITAGTVYLQSTADSSELQYGAGGAITNTQNAAGAASTLQRRDFSVAASGTPPQFPAIAAAIRKYRTHIYFVAPCSVPDGGGVLCTGGADDLGNPVPTLKRLELGAAGAFTIVPIVEGIEAIRVEYGIDNLPVNAVDPGTGSLIGDGLPDAFSHTPSVAEMGNAVAARIYVLARNTTPSAGYVDDKTYTMGTLTTTATNDKYKRHVYGAETRIANQSGRREIPR
jgi:type IV pilus assembly protein PilW